MLTNIAAGLVIGVLSGGAYIIADVAISSATTIGLQEAAGFVVFSGGVVWFLGRKFKSIESRLKLHTGLLTIFARKIGIDINEAKAMVVLSQSGNEPDTDI